MLVPALCFLAFLIAAISFSAIGLWWMGDE
jgi:hypothetical protein